MATGRRIELLPFMERSGVGSEPAPADLSAADYAVVEVEMPQVTGKATSVTVWVQDSVGGLVWRNVGTVDLKGISAGWVTVRDLTDTTRVAWSVKGGTAVFGVQAFVAGAF